MLLRGHTQLTIRGGLSHFLAVVCLVVTGFLVLRVEQELLQQGRHLPRLTVSSTFEC